MRLIGPLILACSTLSTSLVATSANAQALSVANLALGVIRLYKDLPQTVVVTASGTGSTEEKAVERAILAAANQAAGSMIVSEQTVESNQLVKDTIIQHTAGVVNKYEVLTTNKVEDGTYRVRIRAVVSTAPLRKELESLGAKTQDVDGESAFAEQISTRNSITEGRRLVYDVVDRLRQDAIDVKVEAIKLIPTDNEISVLKVPYTVTVSDTYLKSMDEIFERVRTVGNSKLEWDPTINTPSFLFVYPSAGFFGVGGSHLFKDVKAVAEIRRRLDAQSQLDISLRFKDADGNTVGTSCERYRTRQYGVLEYRDDYGPRSEWVKIGGYFKGENRTQLVGMPESALIKIRSVEAALGCSGKPTFNSRGFDTFNDRTREYGWPSRAILQSLR